MIVNFDHLAGALIIAFAVAGVAVILTKAKLFEPLRNRMAAMPGWRGQWLGYLVQCTLCTSVWAALAFTALYRPRLVVSSVRLLDLTVSLFAIITASGFIAWAFYRAYSVVAAGKGCASQEAQIRKLRDALVRAKERLAEQDRLLRPPRQ